MWALFLSYLINFPYYKFTAKQAQSETNLDRTTEKIFKEDSRFLGPLYLFVLMDFCTWIWCLALIGGVYPSWASSFFNDRITQSWGGFMLFTFVWGYMAGVNGLAGHELIHRR